MLEGFARRRGGRKGGGGLTSGDSLASPGKKIVAAHVTAEPPLN